MMSAGEQEAQAEAGAEESGSILDSMLSAMPKVVERDEGSDMVKNLIGVAMSGTMTWDKSCTKTLSAAIGALDQKLSEQLAAVMQHEQFQKLEGSWRGLHHLVMNSETSKQLKLRVLNVSKREVFKDLDKAIEFDQSVLFKKLYEDEFGMPGGEPFGSLVGDFEFTNHPEDIDLLEKISGVCAAAHCPFISAASPNLFGMESWEELSKPRDIEKIFMSAKHTKWNSFRDSEDSRYVTLVLPRVLARLPYGNNTKPIDEFEYEEFELDEHGDSKPTSHEKYTWMNAAYVMGTNMTNAFAQTAWCTAIRGVENGGTVEGLPVHNFVSDDGDIDTKCPTEIGITDRREAELSKEGFLPLCHFKNTDYSVFFGAQTTQRPKKYDTDEATANAAISARLPYIMAASRIAHFLKCIARDKIGSFMERSDMEDFLKRWIANYVLDDPKASAEMKAKYPLAEADISVEEIPGAPGSYNAVALLRPWLQLEELTTSLRMVAKLPQKA
ncbi:type VI secretion protein, EvpB/ family [Fuerstiella marisgermanici]|uniref:Type VI secretion protein, EvpB/ family n=2 Tax=Fuerstiella marisgermanici TaxID=1891926 RepID=A0A1P8WE77_9PLAN|nr:type VI secretion system contractile sheath large subunit [Fuerstiella marisgermanici]APZ92327.1 type VI secretion protein, EvpB/ family [Fuerstiella marisgermanici]